MNKNENMLCPIGGERFNEQEGLVVVVGGQAMNEAGRLMVIIEHRQYLQPFLVIATRVIGIFASYTYFVK